MSVTTAILVVIVSLIGLVWAGPVGFLICLVVSSLLGCIKIGTAK